METRAHHLLIGAFMLLMIGSGLGFIAWLAKVDIDQEYNEFDIYFTESVAGLTRASSVQYNGIPVGTVDTISIAPNDPGQVLVTVKVRSEVPIHTDSVAVLALQGLTGVALVEIEGGSPESPLLVIIEDAQNPVIQSRTSPIQEFFTGGPDLINQAIVLVQKLGELLNKENIDNVGSIINNVDEISAGLAGQTDLLKSSFEELNLVISDIKVAASSINSLAKTAEGVIGDDVRKAIVEFEKLMVSVNEISSKLNTIVDENSGAISSFTNNTLPEISRLVIDVRKMATSLGRLAERLENDPSSLIFSGNKPEYDPKN